MLSTRGADTLVRLPDGRAAGVSRRPGAGFRNAVVRLAGTSDLPSLGNHAGKRLILGFVHRIGVLVIRERAVLDLFHILSDARDRDLRELGVALGELRLEVSEHTKQVVAQENLTIAADSGADPDGRNRELRRNELRD